MKVALPFNEKEELKPLDAASYIGVYDTETGSLTKEINVGYMVSKEMAMHQILTMGVDAVAVKEGFLCPGSYWMSRGKLRYVAVSSRTAKEAINELSKAKPLQELDEEFYAEDY